MGLRMPYLPTGTHKPLSVMIGVGGLHQIIAVIVEQSLWQPATGEGDVA
jgi:hypothetical protein